jgi:hypothetical protein
MGKWEYMTWLVGHSLPTSAEHYKWRGGRVMFVNGEPVKEDPTKMADLNAWLRTAGEQGWELVNFQLPRGGHRLGYAEQAEAVYLFKRPIA